MDLDEKPTKKNGSSIDLNQANLNSLHTKRMGEIKNEQSSLREKEDELKSIILQIQRIKDIDPSMVSMKEMYQLYYLEEEKQQLEAHIHKITSEEIMFDYFLKSGDILYEYYDSLSSSCASQGSSPCIESKSTMVSSSLSNKTKSSLFHPQFTILDFVHEKEEDDIVNKDSKHKIRSKQTLLHKYLTIHNYDNTHHGSLLMEEDFSRIEYINNDICSSCHIEKHFYHQEAIYICHQCGNTESILVDTNRPSYKEPPRELNFYSYKRINHFNEWLAQFQAKETTDIPDEVYNKLLLEMKKERITNMASLTPSKMKVILKKLKLNKYYEHIPHIINNLNSIPPPIMTRETEETLRNMFKQIQAPFMKYCPNDRNNFLSYSYVLHKFCQLLNLDEFLICFSLLKSREKLHKHDQIWEKICQELGWQFIKSI